MTFDEYQKESLKTAAYPNVGHNIIYPTLGLASEAGEVAGKVKKVLRDEGGVMTEEKKQAISTEVGDTLWYIAQLATELGISLEELARQNIEKLSSRKERGVLSGSGDNR